MQGIKKKSEEDNLSFKLSCVQPSQCMTVMWKAGSWASTCSFNWSGLGLRHQYPSQAFSIIPVSIRGWEPPLQNERGNSTWPHAPKLESSRRVVQWQVTMAREAEGLDWIGQTGIKGPESSRFTGRTKVLVSRVDDSYKSHCEVPRVTQPHTPLWLIHFPVRTLSPLSHPATRWTVYMC